MRDSSICNLLSLQLVFVMSCCHATSKWRVGQVDDKLSMDAASAAKDACSWKCCIVVLGRMPHGCASRLGTRLSGLRSLRDKGISASDSRSLQGFIGVESRDQTAGASRAVSLSGKVSWGFCLSVKGCVRRISALRGAALSAWGAVQGPGMSFSPTETLRTPKE